ncbi:hypothetical protein ACP70R_004522 [Stipagrostis hirtigluma subsp. patula]
MAPPAGEVLTLADDILAEFLIRLPTLSDLGRACAACPAFRRVITRRAFLRRLRALRPPPLLGILAHVFIPAAPPHPSAGAARAFADPGAADFSCSFLPSPDRWRRRDVRDGRVLLSADRENFGGGGDNDDDDDDDRGALVRDLAVCDPIHRRYLLLPPIPDDLAALVHEQQGVMKPQPFLAPASEDEEDTSFRVICLVECTSKLVLFTFSSGSGQWQASEFDGWGALTMETSNPDPGFESELSQCCYANRCFCWVMHWAQKLLVLDTSTMEFSSIDIPPAHPMHPRLIVEAGDGKIGMFSIRVDMVYGTFGLSYTVLGNDGEGANEWQPESIIPVPPKYRYNVMGVAGGYLLLQGIPERLYSVPASARPNLVCFSVDLKTFEIEPFCETKFAMILPQLYAGFPPSLSPPTI